MSNTYSNKSGLPAGERVTLKTTGNGTSITFADSDIDLWGHSIELNADSITCEECDMGEEIPELLTMSSGFREVVYKMYILGKFREQSCDSNPEGIGPLSPDKNKVDPITRKSNQVPPGNIYWSGNTTTNSSQSSDAVEKKKNTFFNR